ncbi:MAG: Coenzyme F420 hydrogenase/dehydrogenase, beta subunit C-terminal domain [Roseobacter sp.]
MNDDPITSAVACNLCTGCGACAGGFPARIRMVEDPVNGRRPVVEQSPEGQRASQAAAVLCAGLATDWASLPTRDEIDAAWGPILSAWEGWASDPETRFRGSSGGAVTALAAHALSSGFATGIAHVAARRDDPRLNETVISNDLPGLLRAAGSRYAQASPADALHDIAKSDEPVVFVGKPCDVASVHRATRADQTLAERIPLTIAIFCAGTPNLVATDKLLDSLDVPKSAKLTDLRYRGNGWPGLMQATWQDAAGHEHTSQGISYAKGWGNILQASRQWRCRICADHTGAFADISVGDPWHAPPKGDTDAGRSLIIARTPRGRAFIEAAIQGGALIAEPRSRDVIAQAQPNLSATHGAVWGRRFAMRALGLRTPKDRGQKLFGLWMDLTKRQKVLSVLGTWKRVLRGKLWRGVSISGPAP